MCKSAYDGLNVGVQKQLPGFKKITQRQKESARKRSSLQLCLDSDEYWMSRELIRLLSMIRRMEVPGHRKSTWYPKYTLYNTGDRCCEQMKNPESAPVMKIDSIIKICNNRGFVFFFGNKCPKQIKKWLAKINYKFSNIYKGNLFANHIQ